MKRLFCNFMEMLFVFCIVITTASTVLALSFYPTNIDIIADGIVATGEWDDADYEADSNALNAGAMYAMWKYNYQPGLGGYTGAFQFLLHNIEQLKSQEDADYNVFDIYAPNDPTNQLLRIWVFNDIDCPSSLDQNWLSPAGLSNDFTELDDRGFLVYNYNLNEYRHWLLNNTRPEDGGYDWDYYWGVYARVSWFSGNWTNQPFSLRWFSY